MSLLLSGEVDTNDTTIAALEAENQRLREELAAVKREHSKALGAIRNLERQLTPLHLALQAIFGEIEVIGEGEEPLRPRTKASPVWESWKQKLGGFSAKFIDALLEHGQLTAIQMRVAMHCGNQTVYDTAAKLNKLGLITKNGAKYALRQL